LDASEGNFGKISTFFRPFGKFLRRSRAIFALVRAGDLVTEIERPSARLIIGKGRDRGNDKYIGEPGESKVIAP